MQTKFSKLGFILATAGSAVGVGNIWRFPYIAGEYGGGVFVLTYLLALFVVSFPLLVGETFLGQFGRKDAVSSLEAIAPEGKKYWKVLGFSIVSAFLILAFYNVVVGWILYYAYISLTSLPQNSQEAKEAFDIIASQKPILSVVFFTIGSFIVSWIIYRGVDKGIQRMNLFLMPALVVVLLFMFGYAMTLDSFFKAIEFLFTSDLAKFNSEAVLVAIGQAFFTVSVGVGVVMTYASFSDKHQNILHSSLWIIFLDTFIAIIAGIMIFTFLFANNIPLSESVGLAFKSMPVAFASFGKIGSLLAFMFFVSLAFASITSAISLLEAPVSYLTQRLNISRAKATIFISLGVYVVGLACLFSYMDGFSFLSIAKKPLFDVFNIVTSSVLMPLSGLLMAIFIGWVLDKRFVFNYMKERGFKNQVVFLSWYYLVKIISPIILVAVALKELKII